MAGGGDLGGSASSESSVAGGGDGGRRPGSWSRIKDNSYFTEESWRRGEPEMRPLFGRVVLARTEAMAELERKYRGHALLVTVEGQVRVTGGSLLRAIELRSGVPEAAVKVCETCPPFHFFLQFDSEEDCTRVVHLSMHLRCNGARIGFKRWSKSARGIPGKMEYKCTLSFEGLPEEAHEPQSLKLLIAGLDGELIEMLPSSDKWIVAVRAWLCDPCAVPKQINVVVPAAPVIPRPEESDDDGKSPPRPWSPVKYNNENHLVLAHMKDVIDRGQLLTEGLHPDFLPGPGVDLSRRHTFETWRGMVDGTGAGANGYAWCSL